MNLRRIRRKARKLTKLGPRGVVRVWRERTAAVESIARIEALPLPERCVQMYRERPFEGLHSGKLYRECMDRHFEAEKALKAQDAKAYKKYIAGMRACYIKERIPLLYAQESSKPVAEKVVFMETGNCPSPSSAHISNVMRKQGRYKVKRIGLHRRQVSELEFYENAIGFIKEAADAKAVFFSTANDMFSDVEVRPETKVIQLWHGAGIFKKVGFSTVSNKKFGRSAKDREMYDQYGCYDYVTIPAKAQAPVFEESMRIPADSGVLVDVGVARTDVFYDKTYIDASFLQLYCIIPRARGKKIILYAPTFRGKVGGGRAPDALDIEALGEALADEYVLLIKHHGLAKKKPEIPERWRNSFAFDMAEQSGKIGIDRLLAMADVCITDYSSIAFEYSILERPIVFFAYDLEEYAEERGLYPGFEEMVPGPICRTNEEVVDYIVHLDERFDKQAVIDFKEEYVGRCDGHATERTIALIES